MKQAPGGQQGDKKYLINKTIHLHTSAAFSANFIDAIRGSMG
jgi:hypothetical protein